MRFAPGTFAFWEKPARITWSKVAGDTKRGRGTLARGKTLSLMGEHESVSRSTSQPQNARAERAYVSIVLAERDDPLVVGVCARDVSQFLMVVSVI
jgi:hypothetical protein